VDVAGDPSLADVLGAAQEASTILYPVIVGPASLRDEPALAAWRDLAQQTGGSLVVLDPAGGMDDLARELDRLHARYRLTYPSAVSTQGAHAVQVRVVNEAIDVASPVRTFRAEVLPPEVVFVSPPATLPLTPMEPGDVPGDGQAPTVELPLLITFPDRHPRLIVQTDLLVDGALATSKVQPPYDVVEWTLDPQVVAGGHTLQAVVVDSLGLRAESEPHTLRLVTTRAPSILETRPWLIGLMTFLLVAVAATLGLLPRLVSRPRAPAGGRTALPRLRRATLSPPDADQAEATLEPEEDDLGPIVLTGMDVTFGRDASLATHILLDPSVSPVHARLIRQVNGRYLLRDQDSLAGTWVNHEPVPPGGILLEHCDLVHFGRIGYRFRLAHDPGARQITVTPLGESGMAPAAGFPSP
jgi:hypothetical protein